MEFANCLLAPNMLENDVVSEKKLVETLHGRYHKYQIYRSSTFLGYEFWIYRDGERYRGTFKTLQAAVEAAKKEG